ncbi:MAG: sigma-54 dependent transcriptional regulator [Motiliproteus sp.]
MAYSVLIIEDEAILAKKIGKYLRLNGMHTEIVGTGQAGVDALATFQPDAVLLDFNLPGGLNGLQVLAHIRCFDPHVKVIMVTGHGNERLAVDAMKAGAFDYLSKPMMLSELKLLLEKAMEQHQRDSQLDYFSAKIAEAGSLNALVGQSTAITQTKEHIRRIILGSRSLKSAAPPAVLITGETGTGKELVARALHFDGCRAQQPFIELNAATIPSQLVEAELFGYERGAFTGAAGRKAGLVEAADGGTLFLDEIGELALPTQAKLLRLLEDQRVRRLGSVRDKQVSLQIVTATNRSLREMVRNGTFREDLFFRLNTLCIELPPLRNRSGDAPLLAEHFLAELQRKYGKSGMILSADASAAIDAYTWPGNVRELRNTLEQAVMLATGAKILAEQLNIPRFEFAPRSGWAQPEGSDHPVSPGPVQTESSSPPDSNAYLFKSDDSALSRTLPELERLTIENALKAVDGNVSKAARQLGISRDQLRYRLEKYRLE